MPLLFWSLPLLSFVFLVAYAVVTDYFEPKRPPMLHQIAEAMRQMETE